MGGTVLTTIDTCYNNSATPCTTLSLSAPFSQVSTTTTLPGGANALQSNTTTFYNNYGLPMETDQYDFGAGKVGSSINKSTIVYASLGNGIVDHPASVQLYDGNGKLLQQTTYGYDQSSVTATSGTPNQARVTGSRGNVTSVQQMVSGSSPNLSRSFTYYDTGNLNTSNDVNNAKATYNYGPYSCGNSFVTSIAAPLALSSSQTWDCTGAVVTAITDANGNSASVTYRDANFWRPTSTQDATGATTALSYGSMPAMVESILNFKGAISTADSRATSDSLGRPHISQTRQAQGAANFDSVETDYDGLGRVSRVTVPYTGVAGQSNPSAPATATTYDALRPSGENTKRRQLEHDGAGRLTSVCEITSAAGSGTCSQNSPQTGYFTKYSYDGAGNLLNVVQNAQASSQTRTFTYDGLGRMLTEQSPETAGVASTYVYDKDSTCGTSSGDQVKRIDPMGNVTCYAYDALHRVTAITYPSGTYAAATPAKTYVYDAATVNGAAMVNAKGRLAEAYTGASASKITDLGFSYSARGQISDTYQATPHSGGYYHIAANYWANGTLNVLTPGFGGLPSWTYTPDGEGRVASISASSGQNPLTAANYSAFGPTGITFNANDLDSIRLATSPKPD